jgi:hypothetical protein
MCNSGVFGAKEQRQINVLGALQMLICGWRAISEYMVTTAPSRPKSMLIAYLLLLGFFIPTCRLEGGRSKRSSPSQT